MVAIFNRIFYLNLFQEEYAIEYALFEYAKMFPK